MQKAIIVVKSSDNDYISTYLELPGHNYGWNLESGLSEVGLPEWCTDDDYRVICH